VPVPQCHLTCNSPADCANPNVPARDASHYTCNVVCEYTGCQSDQECSTWFMKPSVCAKLYGATVASCNPKCAAPADCAKPNMPAFDASHYACTSGACEYTGCQSDQECTKSLGTPSVCTTLDGDKIPTCNRGCNTAADCVPLTTTIPAYDASYYTCNSGVCEYTGCKSAQECTMALLKPATCK